MQSSFGTNGRARATSLSALLAALAAAACAAPATVPLAGSTGRSFAEIAADPPIVRYARISPTLSRGGQPDARGLQLLKEQGYKTIVNLRSHHSERAAAEALGLRFVELPLHADVFGSTAPSDDEVRRFFEIVLDPANQPVFFHCAHGKDRAGTMAALYRIEVDGWTNDEAIEEMLAFGYNTMYRDLIGYVRAYKPLGLCLKQAAPGAEPATPNG
jgi:tyrosine-protein phosphatase SIW14